jgi:hypothetical protein
VELNSYPFISINKAYCFKYTGAINLEEGPTGSRCGLLDDEDGGRAKERQRRGQEKEGGRGNPIPRSMRGFLVAPHTPPRHACQSGPGPLSRSRWKKREEEHRQRGRREGLAGAMKPPTPRLATMEAAEQAPARHEVGDTMAGRGGGGGASPRS